MAGRPPPHAGRLDADTECRGWRMASLRRHARRDGFVEAAVKLLFHRIAHRHFFASDPAPHVVAAALGSRALDLVGRVTTPRIGADWIATIGRAPGRGRVWQN